MLGPSLVKSAFLDACLAELRALKPGNVHVHAPGHRMTAAEFAVSARAAAPYIALADLSVGERIYAATRSTWHMVRKNTNLGIVLLAAPLAQAAMSPGAPDLREKLKAVLAGLGVADAEFAYRAIRLASPGGLGAAPEQDVAGPPTVTLAEAMRLAAHRDRIAHQYAAGFEDVFGLGLSALAEGDARFTSAPEWAIAYLYMTLLAAIEDSHVARKFGAERARALRGEAASLMPLLASGAGPEALGPPLLALDRRLKEENVNPGTTADLTVATLFVRALEKARLGPA
jgi:triphosphoribosyl-dephospho-CoA synthase